MPKTPRDRFVLGEGFPLLVSSKTRLVGLTNSPAGNYVDLAIPEDLIECSDQVRFRLVLERINSPTPPA